MTRPHAPRARRSAAVLLIAGALALALAAGRSRPQTPRPPPNVAERAYAANNVGVAWLEQFDFQKGANAFRDALRLDPSLAIARFNLAVALLYANDFAGAERDALGAAKLMPGSPAPAYVLGLVAKAGAHASDAAAAFERVLQIDPEDVGANLELGQVRLQQGDARAAIPRFEAALKVEPFNATAAYNLSVALVRAGRADEGRHLLARFQSLRESGSATTLGSTYLEQGRYAEAIVSTGSERELVDRNPPAVRFVAEPPLDRSSASTVNPVGRRFGPRELDAAALGGGITLFDFDGDGDLDLLDVDASGERLWRNDAGRLTSVAAARFPRSSPGAIDLAVVAGDVNNDGRPDVLVLRYGSVALYRNDGGGVFTDVTAAAGVRIGRSELPLTAAFVDYDHDGDLDILLPGYVDLDGSRAGTPRLFPDDFPPAPTRLWRNNGNGTFTDVTAASRIAIGRATAVVASDYDEQRDIDAIVASDAGRLALFKNLRDGSFQDVARDAGVAATGRLTAVAAADVNHDGRTDFLIGRADGPAVLALSAGRARFRSEAAPGGLAGVLAAQFVDYDNDGLSDLLAWTAQGPRLLRNVGDGWQDVTARAFGGASRGPAPSAFAPGRAIAIADLDGDGDEDFVIGGAGGPQVFRNDGGNRGGALAVRLAARVSNRTGAGSKIEMRAGSLKQRRETFASTPAPAPFDLIFGLGGRSSVDAVRVLWPAGIVQAEVQPPIARPLVVTELNRKPSSCPYLFTWNGTRFEFLSDFLGGGELGYWESPGLRNQPDPDEYVRIPGSSLRPRDGRYDIHITNELEEVLYLDHVRLDAIAHPSDVEVYPNEGLVSPPWPPPKLYTVRNRRPPHSVVDDQGRDVRAAVAAIDRRAPDDFVQRPIRGYAGPHALTIDVGGDGAPADVLLLSGWTDYAFSADNVAAFQQGLRLSPPALQVRGGHGAWRTAIDDIGFPAGRPQTIVVDLRQPALRGHREVRIVTNMRVYWDRIAVATVDATADLDRRRLDVTAARLAWRGFSAESTPDGREPFVPDYTRVSAVSPWKTLTGRYTPEGDVRSLLTDVDDRFVVARPGDDIAVAFAALPSVPAGWTRTFLLYADGFSKEMDLHSASPDHVEPLPFHAMRAYPPAGESNPHGPQLDGGAIAPRHVPSQLLSIDAFLLLAKHDKE